MNMNSFMISCKETTLLVEKKSLFGLSFKDRLQLKMHTMLCEVCRRYQLQSNRIDLLLHQFLDPALPMDAPLITNPELKETIIKNL